MNQIISHPPSEETIFNSKLFQLRGSDEEILYMKKFPFDNYEIYHVPPSFSFFLDSKQDFIKDRLKKGILWEDHLYYLLSTLPKRGSTVVDIGAHIGTHTLLFSQIVGDEGLIISFEPQMKLYRELIMNLRLNHCTNVISYRCALGNKNGVIEMNPPSHGNEGGVSIGKGGDHAMMMKLDDLCLSNLSLIKIDVENSEYLVLQGAIKTLQKHRPHILLEIIGNHQGLDEELCIVTSQVIDFLNSLNYFVIHLAYRDFLAIPF